jgi:signal transduction histidine kinase
VEVRKARVGTLLLQSPDGPWSGVRGDGRGPPAFFWPVLRSLLLAGLGLASGLLLLAVVFAQRLSRPLRKLTAAAQALAAGKLDLQVDGAPVRELDELAQAFNRMAHALAQADQQRRQMTADIAHELRTPLTIIKGRLEGLQDGVYSATPDQIERLLEETTLLERLVEDLRLLALVEAGQLPLYRETIDPRDLLEGTAAAFAGQAEAHGVALRIEAPPDLPQIDVDPQRMTQVLANLVTNALRYTATGGTITLEAKRSVDGSLQLADQEHLQAAIVLQVSDTGEGIAPEDLPHIFDRFWRANRARARESGGAGLGLAIAKQVVAAHGGAIWAASACGQGTTISIVLPASHGG